MDKIEDILLTSNNSNIRNCILIQKSYKKIVNEKIFSITTDLIYKNNILYIYVKDNVWATQLHQYKHTIFKKTKQIVGSIKDVRIKVSFLSEQNLSKTKSKVKIIKKDFKKFTEEINKYCPKYKSKIEKIMNHSVINYEHRCVSCGSPLLSGKNNFCSLCIHHNNENKKINAQNILEDTPWVKFDEISTRERKNMDYQGFMQEKKFKINRICDIIKNEYFDIKKNKKAKKEFFKQKIEELVILKLSIEPSELTEQIIENNIPKNWFKLYQN